MGDACRCTAQYLALRTSEMAAGSIELGALLHGASRGVSPSHPPWRARCSQKNRSQAPSCEIALPSPGGAGMGAARPPPAAAPPPPARRPPPAAARALPRRPAAPAAPAPPRYSGTCRGASRGGGAQPTPRKSPRGITLPRGPRPRHVFAPRPPRRARESASRDATSAGCCCGRSQPSLLAHCPPRAEALGPVLLGPVLLGLSTAAPPPPLAAATPSATCSTSGSRPQQLMSCQPPLQQLLQQHYCTTPAVDCTSSGLRQQWTAPAVHCTSSGLHQQWTAPAVDCTSSGLHQQCTAPAVDCTSSGLHQQWTAPAV